jgi:hypothetical protein
MGTRIIKYDLEDLVRFIESKHVATPEFQRGFVWKTKQVKNLFDSLVKQYPVGSFILWETTKTIDARTLDGERLPKKKFLILDGQQRLASIFYLCRQKKFAEPYVKGKFQEACDSRARDVIDFEKFYVGRDKNGDPELKNDDRDSYCKLDFQRFQRLVKRSYRFPVVVISLNDYRQAIQVFERINQAGTRISTESIFLSETWNHHSHISGILRSWKRHKKDALTSAIDTVIFIHAFAIMLQLEKKNNGTIEIGVKTLKKIADEVREGHRNTHNRVFKDVVSSIARAVRHLKEYYDITNLGALPSQTMITVLSVFFYYQQRPPTAIQLKELHKWFWRSSLASRYIGADYSKNINSDVKQMRALAERNSRLSIPRATGQVFAKLQEVDLRTGRSTYRNIIKQALWQQKPVFIDGSPVRRSDVELGQHKPDDDHFFPYNLSRDGVIGSAINNILNLHFLNHDENIRKSKQLPSKWMQRRIDEIQPKLGDIKKYFDSQLLPFKSVRELKRYEKAFRHKGRARAREFARSYGRFLKKRFRLFERALIRLQNGAVR